MGNARRQTAYGGQLFAAADLLPRGLVEKFFALGDRLGHAVHGPAERAHLARRPNAHSRRQVAANHLLGHLHHEANGTQDTFVDQEKQYQAGQGCTADDRQEHGANDPELMGERSLQKAHVEHPDNLPRGVTDRFIGRDVPIVDHECRGGPSLAALQDRIAN